MIDAMVIYNYSLPGESLELNDLTYPVDNFSTEIELRSNDTDLPAASGIWPRNTFYGRRLFHIEGNILANNSEEYNNARLTLQRMLVTKSHLRPRKPQGYLELWFSGLPDKLTCEFTVDSYPEIPLEALSPARSRFQINLKCFDPRLYGTARVDEAYPPIVSGRSYNKTYNKVYSLATVDALNININNHGNVEVYPTILFYGPATNPQVIRIDDDGTTHSFALQGLTLSSSDIIEADFTRRTTKNLVTGGDVFSYKQGEWWPLEPGNNVVRTNAASASPASKTVFQWRDAYML